ncbi:formimidoylglutamase [Rhodococcus sp. 14C212]|uniref:formimidoylglutamase n=1 Tax=Rhodococcus sp. 14C212 TaxID=2711209 RepID=UPI0013ECB418|nr:formimidoylglutamase [Rhodococcus sp. 14C212]
MTIPVDVPPAPWTGRDDGPGPEHLRWHDVVSPLPVDAARAQVLLGFRSDEGVRRNQGRAGAADGPIALRRALASLALPAPATIHDAGDIAVHGGALEDGQRRLGAAVTALLDAEHAVVVLGGGHEVSFGSYLGWAGSAAARAGTRWGVLNLDAHFDLRAAPVATSGTPFRQMAERERRLGRSLRYAVVGIAQPSNTAALFAAADELGVRYLLDDECRAANLPVVETFVEEFVRAVDAVHLTVDLDVLPGWVAPGVSAPAACGVAFEVVQHVCDVVARSGRLALVDVAELAPAVDVDGRTARVAARLIHRIVTGRPAGDHPRFATTEPGDGP